MEKKARIVKSHDVHIDAEYTQWIHEVKARYRATQIKAAVKVNTEQLMFNWMLGRDLVVRKAEEKWGSGIVEQVSLDLQNDFPSVKGFSTTNLWYMKKWYLFYGEKTDYQENCAIEVNDQKLHQLGGESAYEKLHQPGGEMPELFGYIPWRHHVEIITKCSDIDEAMFYLRKTVQEGWSRNALLNAMEAELYKKSGGAITNFEQYLPSVQSKLAQEITKETYDLGFITLPPEYDEKDLEDALERNITQFLLELGTGFAFVGRQKEIIVSGKSRKIDMLFYHIRLKCYVVVELKATAFDPEFAGKLNFYVNAVNELIKTKDENPTIGLLICKNMDQTEVKWAFQGIQTPMGVATYNKIQINELEEILPSAEAIQKRIEQAEIEFRLAQNGDRK